MKKRYLKYLKCPKCKHDLNYYKEANEKPESIKEYLKCNNCSSEYPIKQNVPIFEESEFDKKTERNFGYSWNIFSDIYKKEKTDFLNWVYPVKENFFNDKIILDAGCGNGLHARMASEFGAKTVFGLDLSSAVYSAHQNTKDLENIQIVKGNLYSPPFEDNFFDYIYSIGVLQHLPLKEKAIEVMYDLLKTGGSLSLWVYGYEGTFFVRTFIEPIRKLLSFFPPFIIFILSVIPAVSFYIIAKIYKIACKLSKKLCKFLPLGEYFSYMANFPFKYQFNTVFDQLVAPRSYFFKKEELETIFKSFKFQEVIITPRNNMSWRIFAKEKLS
jgi:SAM-dependent methyltransferase